MQKEIHPTINSIKTTCTTCGQEYELQSTSKAIKVDVCAACHPIYTGKQVGISKAGRVDRFNKKISPQK